MAKITYEYFCIENELLWDMIRRVEQFLNNDLFDGEDQAKLDHILVDAVKVSELSGQREYDRPLLTPKERETRMRWLVELSQELGLYDAEAP